MVENWLQYVVAVELVEFFIGRKDYRDKRDDRDDREIPVISVIP